MDDFLLTSDGKIELTPNEWASISAMLSDDVSAPFSPSPMAMDTIRNTDDTLRRNAKGEVVRKRIIETILKRRKTATAGGGGGVDRSRSPGTLLLFEYLVCCVIQCIENISLPHFLI